MKKKTISLCMIVKDEEAFIENCLRSVKDIVDEIVIVDTGSTDHTVDICRSFGAKIVEFPWMDDFASARNRGLLEANGDWILWLDADEELDQKSGQILIHALDQNEHDFFSIHLVNYMGEHVQLDNAYLIAHTRLFRNHKGIQFKNRIHEILDTPPPNQIPILPIKVYHYGYLDPVVRRKNKSQRNMTILENEMKKSDYDPWIPYHIASEYYRIQEYDKAFQYVNMSILQFLLKQLSPPSLLYKLKYSILLSVGSIDTAWSGIQKAIELHPDYVDLHFYKGIILLVKEQYSDSLAAFEHCIYLGEEYLNHLVLHGVGTFQAWYYIGVCFEKMNCIDDAKDAYKKSIDLSSSYLPPREALLKCLSEEDHSITTTDIS
ncbi:glycosyltransferase [Paenibacillus ferrarius]|uniref:glycosyltransferase n=1 Tax=Paenibacillus ferrarius TaxID=1469647 RepID=UPI003D288868